MTSIHRPAVPIRVKFAVPINIYFYVESESQSRFVATAMSIVLALCGDMRQFSKMGFLPVLNKYSYKQ